MDGGRIGRIRVLHVDDEPEFGELVTMFLERERENFEVVTATNAQEGLDYLSEAETIDCIVSDYDIPTIDGLEFLETVREAHPKLPFILFTGRGSEGIASEAITAGVSEYLNKEGGTEQYTVLANRIDDLVTQYRAERELEATNERVRNLYSGITDAIFSLDGEGRFTHLNHRAEELLERSETAVLGEDIEDVFPEGAGTTFESEIRRAVTKQVPVEFEEYYPPLDAWHHVRAVPIGDGVTIHVNDVAEKKAREREIQRQNGRLQAILNNLPIILFGLDENGVYTLSKGRGLEEIGLLPDGSVGESAFEIHAGTPIAEDVQRAIDGEAFHTVREGANDRVFETWYQPVDKDEIREAAICVLLDITDRKRNERNLTALHEATREIMVAETAEEVATIATAAANDILGLPLNAIHLHDADRDQFVPLAFTSAARELFGEAPPIDAHGTVAGAVFETGEFRLYDDVRHAPQVANDDTPIRSELIFPLGDHGVFTVSSTDVEDIDDTDVTLTRMLAANVEIALDQAEHRTEIAHQNEHLEDFVSAVTHDLRNPLVVAKGHLELARESSNDEHFVKATSALDRMEAIIGDVLTLARQGRAIGDTQPVLLEEVIDRAWTNVETENAALQHEDLDGGMEIAADESRLEELFENLFGNAIDHGGPDVTVRVGSFETGFYVEDDGPGIPPNRRDRVFDYGHSTSENGTGFGLAIVRRIVRAHGWRISLSDGTDGGARFAITL